MHAALSLDLMLSTVHKQGGTSALHALLSCAQLCLCSIWSKLPCSCWSLGGQLHSHASLSCAQLDTWASLPCLLAVQAPAGVRLMAQPRTAVMHSIVLAQHLDPACHPSPLPFRVLHMLAAQDMARSVHLLLDLLGFSGTSVALGCPCIRQQSGLALLSVAPANIPTILVQTYPTKDFATFEEALSALSEEEAWQDSMPESAALACAGPGKTLWDCSCAACDCLIFSWSNAQHYIAACSRPLNYTLPTCTDWYMCACSGRQHMQNDQSILGH